MSDAERRAFANLVLLCKPCHDLVDKTHPDDYSVERLEEWKRAREGPDGRDLAALGDINEAALADLVIRVAKTVGRDWGSTQRQEPAVARFDVPRPSRTNVARPAKLEEVVGFLGAATTVTVTSLKGAGGVGKTVLAQQVAYDPRVRAAYPGGIWWLSVGEEPQLEQLAEVLYRKASGGREPAAGVSVVGQLADVMANAAALVLLDDVWAPPEAAERLLDALPVNVHALITTRGAELPGSAYVTVDELTVDEARQVLLGEHAAEASAEYIAKADDLAQLLGRWALLVAMAAAVLRPHLPGPPSEAIAALETIAAEFRADPTVLDDEASRQRSFARIIERSEGALRERGGPAGRDVERFRSLGVYPPDAALEVELLADLWQCRITEALRTAQRIAGVGLATLEPPNLNRPLVLTLHDLIVGYLHHLHCRPGQFPERHRRCAMVAIGTDGQPLEVTPPRARWLVHHLVAAQEWSQLEHLASTRWRSALLACTGTDAALFGALDAYATAALNYLGATEAAHHALGAVVFAAHVRALIGNVPVEVLRTTVLLGNPHAALVQAAQRPDAGTTFPDVFAVVLRTASSVEVEARAVELAAAIPDVWARSQALAGIAQQLAACDPTNAGRIEQAVELTATIPDFSMARSQALAGIAQQLAACDPTNAGRIEQAVELTATIPDVWARSEALAGIAQHLAASDPNEGRRLERAAELAATIPDVWIRVLALGDIGRQAAKSHRATATELMERAVELAATMSDDLARSQAQAAIAGQIAESDATDASRIERALALATGIHDISARNDALASIALHVAATDPTDDRCVGRAMALVDNISGDVARSHAIADIAQQLAASDPRNAVRTDQAIELAMAIHHDVARCHALADIARELVASNPGDAGRAVALVEAISNEWARGHVLADIARQLASDGTDSGRTEQAIALAMEIQDDSARSEALAGIIERVVASDPTDAGRIERAIDLAAAIPSHQVRSQALAGIAEQVATSDPTTATELISGAVELVILVPDDRARSQALADITQQVVASDPTDAGRTGPAIELATIIPDEVARSRALAAIAQQLVASDPTDARSVERAVALADIIPGDGSRSRALARIARQLAASDPTAAMQLLNRAVELAGTIPGDDVRSWALADIAEQLAASDPSGVGSADRAVQLAITVPDDVARSWALAGIAEHVAASDPTDAGRIGWAIALADTIPRVSSRSQALAGIAQQLTELNLTMAVNLIQRAVELAATVPDDEDRSQVLAGIAGKIATSNPAIAMDLIEGVIELASAISDDTARSRALVSAAQHLAASDPTDAGRIDRAIELAETIPYDAPRGDALAFIARILMSYPVDPCRMERALELADTIPEDWSRSWTLGGIAGSIGDTGWCVASWRQMALNDFLEAIASFGVMARAHHLDVGMVALSSVIRAVKAFSGDDLVSGERTETAGPLPSASPHGVRDLGIDRGAP